LGTRGWGKNDGAASAGDGRGGALGHLIERAEKRGGEHTSHQRIKRKTEKNRAGLTEWPVAKGGGLGSKRKKKGRQEVNFKKGKTYATDGAGCGSGPGKGGGE